MRLSNQVLDIFEQQQTCQPLLQKWLQNHVPLPSIIKDDLAERSQIEPVQWGAFFKFLFRWIHYYHSSKFTGKETCKTYLCAVAWPIFPADWVCWNHKISNIIIGLQKDFEPMARETYFSKHGGKQKMDCYIYCCYLCMFFNELTYRKGLFPWCIGSKINQTLLV